MNKRKCFINIFACIRIVCYILIAYIIINLLTNKIKFLCYFNDKYGILCPSCGATRATLSIIKGEIILALKYNLIYTIAIFPLTALFILDDIFIVLGRALKMTKKRTLIETLCELESGEEIV